MAEVTANSLQVVSDNNRLVEECIVALRNADWSSFAIYEARTAMEPLKKKQLPIMNQPISTLPIVKHLVVSIQEQASLLSFKPPGRDWVTAKVYKNQAPMGALAAILHLAGEMPPDIKRALIARGQSYLVAWVEKPAENWMHMGLCRNEFVQTGMTDNDKVRPTKVKLVTGRDSDAIQFNDPRPFLERGYERVPGTVDYDALQPLRDALDRVMA